MRNRYVFTLMVPALLLPTVGCYQSVPVATPAPTPRTKVELQLTDRGVVDLAPRLGTSIDKVEGTVASATDSTIRLALTSATDRRGVSTTWMGELVDFRRDHIARLSERRLSRTRSWLLTAGIVAVALAAGGIGGAFGGEERVSEGSTQ